MDRRINIMDMQEVTITEEDVVEILDIFTRVPYLILRSVVRNNKNVVKSFENQISSYNEGLSNDDRKKIKKVCEMPVSELQTILDRAYTQTNKRHLKLLANPESQNFIENNLKELETLLF